MILHSVNDLAFNKYGVVLEGYDFKAMIDVLNAKTQAPTDKTIYVASSPELEATAVFKDLEDRLFGGLPIQAGYCNGTNTMLNCLEYHRGSEAFVAADDVILLLAAKQDIINYSIDTAKVEAFLVPKGVGILYYETALHYAPARAEGPFRTVIVLPRTTNTDMPDIKPAGSAIIPTNKEDKLLLARNKWLIAHPDSPEAKNGAFIGLTGKNIDIAKDISK